ncbi:MAG: nitrilase-related carbon-nitrogen hydrolase [Wenzhouxiangellaceae bacterium]|nr:nitrilase-related carbon-nitrogen hydrolase [Wenzhouxiangellaceae bacterium]
MAAPKSRIHCALVQADTRWSDPAANRENLAALMDRAPGRELYVLPETCTTGFLGDQERRAQLERGEDLDWLLAQARDRQAAIACSLVVIEDGRVFNRFVLARADGSRAHYDKRHLFAFGGEDRRYAAGRQRTRTELHGWRVDLQVCYDLRFPAWCRNDDAFDLQIFVANWPSPRVSHWQALLRARAIENQAFVIGVNRTGVDGNGIVHPGASVVFDPLGELLLGPLGAREQVAGVSLDRDHLQAVRERFPFLADRDRFALD